MSRPLVVVGDAFLDVDLVGSARRLCPDAPAPVVESARRSTRPGGAGLAALLAAQSGKETVLLSPLVDDEAAAEVMDLLASRVQVVPLPASGATAIKTRVRSGATSLVRVDTGGCQAAGPLPPAALSALRSAGAVLVSDYGYGTAAVPAVRTSLGRRGGPPVVWDPHPRGPDPVSGVRLVTPSAAEAIARASTSAVAADDQTLRGWQLRAAALVERWQAAAVAITLGERGALLSYGDGAPLLLPAPKVPASDACGAGDCFAATAAALLADGAVAAEAVEGAVLAASAFVARGGAAAVPVGAAALAAGRRDVAEPARTATHVRAAGGTVVATGGCFDLLHAGHVATLTAARELGDWLVVCLNSDSSVRRLKGPGRPLVPAADRARVLSALACVDEVVVFDEDTPAAVLERIRPQVWVKGGDYAGSDLPEADVLATWDGQVVVLPYLEGRSTTQLASRAT